MRGVLAALIGALVLGGSATAATAPTLKLKSLHPFVVRGGGFHARVHVVVTLIAPTLTERRTTRTTAAGTFSADFGTVLLGHCAGFKVRAVGGAQTVTLKRPPLPACMP
jgi:hypothetical protein